MHFLMSEVVGLWSHTSMSWWWGRSSLWIVQRFCDVTCGFWCSRWFLIYQDHEKELRQEQPLVSAGVYDFTGGLWCQRSMSIRQEQTLACAGLSDITGPRVGDEAGAACGLCSGFSCHMWSMKSQMICEVTGTWVGDGVGAFTGFCRGLWCNVVVSDVTGSFWMSQFFAQLMRHELPLATAGVCDVTVGLWCQRWFLVPQVHELEMWLEQPLACFKDFWCHRLSILRLGFSFGYGNTFRSSHSPDNWTFGLCGRCLTD